MAQRIASYLTALLVAVAIVAMVVATIAWLVGFVDETTALAVVFWSALPATIVVGVWAAWIEFRWR